MRNISLIFCSFLIFCNCSKPLLKISSAQEKRIITDVNTVVNDWHKAASEANFDNYFNKMDAESIFIGTDANENWTKKQFSDFSKPYFDKGKAWDFKTLERNIYINNSGNFVWFDELLNTWMGTCRGSGVLEKVNNNWVIQHYVLSVSIPNDDVQAVIEAKKKNDVLFLKRYEK